MLLDREFMNYLEKEYDIADGVKQYEDDLF